MFKPTKVLLRSLRRLALTTKQVNGGFYKGTGSGSMGRHTKHGGYIIEWAKVRTYVVPEDLKDFKVRRHMPWQRNGPANTRLEAYTLCHEEHGTVSRIL